MGATDDQLRIAQQGFAEGLMKGVTIRGLDAAGFVRESARLDFQDITNDDNLTLDTSKGQAMTEALSVHLAKAVEYSVGTMQRKGLATSFVFHFKPHVATDPAVFEATLARFGLAPSSDPGTPPGTALRAVVKVVPGRDAGITYSHFTAWRTP